MYVTRLHTQILTDEEKEHKIKMEIMTKKYVRNTQRSKDLRKEYGKNYKQPIAMNVDLCFEEPI